MNDYTVLISLISSVLTGVVTAVSVVSIMKNDIGWIKGIIQSHSSHHAKHFSDISSMKERISKVESHG